MNEPGAYLTYKHGVLDGTTNITDSKSHRPQDYEHYVYRLHAEIIRKQGRLFNDAVSTEITA
jgi:hypothetical protein